MADLPTGTVTFLFTDLEGSTRLWEEHPESMNAALARHDQILRAAITAHDGIVVKSTGDGVHAVFVEATAAVHAARDAQLALLSEDWGDTGPLRVRMGLHTGPAEVRAGDYYGPAVNRAARLMSAANGGQVVLSLATEELVRDAMAADIDFVDLGEHRLRDLSRPERLFQLAGPGLPRDFPPLHSLDMFAGNLPAQVTSFVGRASEIAAVTQALMDARLVTITGVGGVGKTRLALQVAAEVLPRYPDGAWFCELAAAEDEETMLQVVASSLDVAPRSDMSFADSVVDFLRGKRLLLVLDNCEHLLEPVAAFAEHVLRDCRDVHVLTTSREVLSVAGEHVVGLRSLAVPNPTDSPENIASSDAVELFTERARAARANFVVDATNAQAVAEICRRLDGIPLAIELAAARTAAMSAPEIASHLDERFRLLRGARHSALERHQTLRATVDWSYSLLDDTDRAVFVRLGVFAGLFDADDARAVVCGEDIDDWDVLDALASLVAKSMVLADEDDSGVTRYQMLETIRAYARERLDEGGESDAWRRRLAARYAAFSAEARSELLGPNEIPWRRRLRLELDNVRAGVFWSLDSDAPGDHSFALTVVANFATEVTLDRAGDYGAWAERALPFVDEARAAQRPAILAAAAFNVYHRGDIEAARRLAADALKDGVPVDCPSPAIAYIARAVIDMSSGRNAEAVAVLTDALDHSEAIKAHEYSRANVLAVRSFTRLLAGDGDGARRDVQQSLELSRRMGNPSQMVIALTALGNVLINDDPAGAREAFEESITLVATGASNVNLSLALVQLARLRMRDGDMNGALNAARVAVTHHDRLGDRPGLVGTLLGATEILMSAGAYRSALVVGAGAVLGSLRPLAAGMGVAVSELTEPFERAREALGYEECNAAIAEGTALSYEELVTYALDAIDNAIVRIGGTRV